MNRLLAVILLIISVSVDAQRIYSSHSVLETGNWFKIGVNNPGIYKIDIPFLAKLGVNTNNLAASSIRLFGNGGAPLPEKPNGFKYDDLFENAIWIEDGGDGTINGPDYILFYANGPHCWTADTIQKTFRHQKNIYSEQSFFYLNISSNGKRVPDQAPPLLPNNTITSYNSRYYHELDTLNFLSSGKEWYGEEFSTMPGKQLNRSFPVLMPSITNQPGTFLANSVARSFGTGSRFNISINSIPVSQIDIPPVASGSFDLFAQTAQTSGSFISNSSSLDIQFSYSEGSFSSQGWLNWFEVHARSNLSLAGVDQLLFRDWNSVAMGNTGRFIISNATPATQVWDISDPLQPIRMLGNLSGSIYEFVQECSRLHEYIAFTNSNFLTPLALGKISNQDLHNGIATDFLIITHPTLLSQAQRLALYHQQREGLKTVVVTAEQIFNEFSSGTPDPVAIRDFAKMYFDRAGADTLKRSKYLLLFGDASFDYKNRIRNNTNLVPAYESSISLDPLSTYTTDDFFGLLDDGDDINGNGTYLLDIGIGRIPAADENTARSIVDKIIAYHSAPGLGPWRNELTFIADDEDANLHFQDAEIITAASAAISPVFNIDKIYLDAYKQEGGSGGSRYPEVNNAINSKLFNGTLIWNYSGHGGFRRLAEEVVLDQEIINKLNNFNRLPLFITATCDFAPFDNPLINSIGENLILREKTGAIALMTTTRLVFAFSNRVMNKNYLEVALQRKPDGSYYSLGEAVKKAKNYTYTTSSDVVNNRKFTLLGDPALTIAFPPFQVKTSTINTIPLSPIPDTLKALSTYTITGEITDQNGNPLNNFSGTVYPVVFDKTQNQSTRANDPGSIIANFPVQKNILFRGKAKVENGKFSFTFIVPKDIDYKFGNGRISYYTDNGTIDGNGLLTGIIIGGTGAGIGDKEGPNIKGFLNDEKFVSGSITGSSPILIVRLQDSSGINVMGTGIGHDLSATLDNDPQKVFVLNQFYEAELDDFRKGIVRYQLPTLEEGLHTLTIKAWDIANNSSEITIEFRIVKPQKFTLEHVLNYPNPFTTNTNFWFSHNRAAEELKVFIQVFTVSGKLVKTIRKTIFSEGNRSSEVDWDGRDEYGSKLGRGVYIYHLKVQTTDGKSDAKWEKLFIL